MLKVEFLQSETLTDKDEKSAQIVHFLPSLESHLRPLIDSLKTDSERIAVWKNVVYDSQGDEVKITAAYVQNKVDEFIASGANKTFIQSSKVIDFTLLTAACVSLTDQSHFINKSASICHVCCGALLISYR